MHPDHMADRVEVRWPEHAKPAVQPPLASRGDLVGHGLARLTV
jgi:hypothetical protein